MKTQTQLAMRELTLDEIEAVSGAGGCAALHAIAGASGWIGGAGFVIGVAGLVPGPHSLAAGAIGLGLGGIGFSLWAASEAIGAVTGC